MAKGNTHSFADIIEDARRTPGAPGRGHDLTSPFGARQPTDHRVVELGGDGDRVPGAPAFEYSAHVNRFVIPGDEAAYQDVLNSILQAKAILRYEDRSITKEGDCIVIICFLTLKRPVAESCPRT